MDEKNGYRRLALLYHKGSAVADHPLTHLPFGKQLLIHVGG